MTESVADEVTLSEEQQNVIKDVHSGRSVFITGSAGVGKSFLLQNIIKSFPKKNIYITASTGVAACNIGGSTLHSFAGIGLGDKSAELYANQIRYKRFKVDVKERWEKCQVLVIDEISMIDGFLFKKVEEVARLVRKKPAPFGGIQLILCGDFLQLPPVKSSFFAFETDAWKRSVSKTIVLGKVFRQRHFGFVSLLNRLRVGYITSVDIEVLHCCHRTLFPDDGIKATSLFPLRASCDRLNQNELNRLCGKPKKFEANDFYQNDYYKKQLETSSRFAKELVLKEGAQVMLLCNKNIKDGLVNGARGVVTGFHDRNAQRKKEIMEEMAEREPMLNTEEYAMKLNDYFQESEVDATSFPIVRFVNGTEMVISPEQNVIEIAGRTVAYRSQLPLALAWAVSIHKAQGVTLDRVEINLEKAFEHGQSYVALSRVTSLDGLLLRAFNPTKITAHPKVLAYYTSIDSTFPQCTKTMGEDDLRTFLKDRNNYAEYKRQIDEQTSIHKMKEEHAFRCLREHDYCKPDPSAPNILQTNAQSSSNGCSSSNTASFSNPCSSSNASSSSNAHTSHGVIDLTSTNSPSKENTGACTQQGVDETPCTSSNFGKTIPGRKQSLFQATSSSSNKTSPPVATKILSKADEILQKCKQSINDVHKIDKTTTDIDDVSFFDDDDDEVDGLFEEELCKVKPVCNTPKTANKFFQQICPDLLKSSSSLDNHTPLKRGQKRRASGPHTPVRALNSPHNKSGGESKEYIETMLKEKEQKIEENRRKALERRYNSLLGRNKTPLR